MLAEIYHEIFANDPPAVFTDNPGKTLFDLFVNLVDSQNLDGPIYLTLGRKIPGEPLRQSYPLYYRLPYNMAEIDVAIAKAAALPLLYAFAQIRPFQNGKPGRTKYLLTVASPDAPESCLIRYEIKHAPTPEPKFLPVK